jgi:hypothetical protein
MIVVYGLLVAVIGVGILYAIYDIYRGIKEYYN